MNSSNSGNKAKISSRREIREWSGDEYVTAEAFVPVESAITLIIDGRSLATLHCSPDHLDDLARGYLLGQGLLSSPSDITSIAEMPDDSSVVVELGDTVTLDRSGDASPVLYSGCGQGMSPAGATVDGLAVPSGDAPRSPREQLEALRQVLDRGEAYRRTRGMHSAGLLSRHGRLLCHREDVGRHSALDKVLGWAAAQCLEPDNISVALSGRVSVDAVMKAARFRIPVVISKGVPTSMALDEAERLGLSLASSIGRRRLRVYTHAGRFGP